MNNKLQEKFNDWCDAGGHAVEFYAKNQLLGDKHETMRQELEKNYQELEEKRQKDPSERIKIIRKRLDNYNKHQNDPYAYFPGEINEVRTLLHHAPEDIEFLLTLVGLQDKRIDKITCELFEYLVQKNHEKYHKK